MECFAHHPMYCVSNMFNISGHVSADTMAKVLLHSLKGNSKKMLQLLIKKAMILNVESTTDIIESFNGMICDKKNTIKVSYITDNDPKSVFPMQPFIWTIDEKDIIQY
jgi:hypothetical protein